MKKTLPLILGMLFLILDYPIRTGIVYPAFIPFRTSAPESVSMIIDHLVGTNLRIDIFPDLIGYILLFFGCASLISYQKRFARCTVWIILAAAANLLCILNPLLFQSYTRYSLAYIVLIVATLLKAAVMIHIMLTFLNFSECTENHAWNNVVAIFMLIAVFTMVIRNLSFLYMWDSVAKVYNGVSLVATLIYVIMYCKRLNYFRLERQKQNS